MRANTADFQRYRFRPRALVDVSRRDQSTTVLGIPVTSPGRTLLDLAATLPLGGVERALERMEALKITHVMPL